MTPSAALLLPERQRLARRSERGEHSLSERKKTRKQNKDAEEMHANKNVDINKMHAFKKSEPMETDAEEEIDLAACDSQSISTSPIKKHVVDHQPRPKDALSAKGRHAKRSCAVSNNR